MNETRPASGRRQIVRTVFWIVAILLTAFAWAGLSLKELLAAVAF